MQYSIALPRDYDMAIVQRRIADKGPRMDDFPQLAFKAFLTASCDDAEVPSRDNLYAPFYLWQDTDGMHAFLAGDGFAALCADFGRPSIQWWSVWAAKAHGELALARMATRERRSIDPHQDLGAWRQDEQAAVQADLAAGAVLALSGYEPDGWTLVRLRLWPRLPTTRTDATQAYRIGHLARPGADALRHDSNTH